MYTNMYKHNCGHVYTCIHMVYIKSSESKGTLVLSIVCKLGRMESLTLRVVVWSHAHLYVHTYIHKQIHNLYTYVQCELWETYVFSPLPSLQKDKKTS